MKSWICQTSFTKFFVFHPLFLYIFHISFIFTMIFSYFIYLYCEFFIFHPSLPWIHFYWVFSYVIHLFLMHFFMFHKYFHISSIFTFWFFSLHISSIFSMSFPYFIHLHYNLVDRSRQLSDAAHGECPTHRQHRVWWSHPLSVLLGRGWRLLGQRHSRRTQQWRH